MILEFLCLTLHRLGIKLLRLLPRRELTGAQLDNICHLEACEGDCRDGCGGLDLLSLHVICLPLTVSCLT